MAARPACTETATADSTRTVTGMTSTPKAASLTSLACTFLPRYSGVRPIISPPTNTATMANSRTVYSPLPSPPGLTSPSIIPDISPKPPMGLNESLAPETEPVEVCVEAMLYSVVGIGPKRTSLPCMLPAGWATTWAAATAGLGCDSAYDEKPSQVPKMTAMAASSAKPWRVLPTILPKGEVRATGMARTSTQERNWVKPVGSSQGWARSALNTPPPLVPSSLTGS